MSSPETQVEIQTQELKPSQITKLIEEAKSTEWKYLLKLNIEGRTEGCGYRYMFGDSFRLLFGNINKVVLKSIEDNNCYRKSY
jgi:hypothetical protein